MDDNIKLKRVLETDQFSYEYFIEMHSDPIYVLDSKGNIVDFNEGFRNLTGYDRDELMRMNALSILYAEDVQKVMQYLKKSTSGNPERRQFRIVKKQGEIRTMSTDAIPITIEGNDVGLFVIGKDITEWLKEINHQQNKFHSLIKNSSDVISIIDETSTVVYYSESVESVLGYKVEEMNGSIHQIMHPDDFDRINQVLKEIYGKKPNDKVIVEFRLKHKNGDWLNMQAIATNLLDDPDVNGVVVNYRDITDLKKAQQKVQYIAHHDYLTDLPNRRFFEESLMAQLDIAKQQQSRFAVVIVDLDNFKSINDTLGHESGDILLKKVAQTLKELVSNKGMVSRWGGDEFLIMLPSTNDADVNKLASNIKRKLNETFTINNYDLIITGSIGISIYPDSGEDVETLIKTADLAMYLTKEHGKNDFQIFTKEMMMKATKTFALQRDLHRALSNNEFELYYQPKINAKSGNICGAEALIRWNHPELGMIPPNDFIYLAEESGIIVLIGDWVYKEACKQVKQWQEAGNELIQISVNFSTLQFLQKDLVERISSCLKETGIDGKWIQIEITESILINSGQELRNKIEEIKQLGVQIALDDFGTGYSSIDYLRKFGFNTIKLDRSFICDIHTNKESAAIASFMVALGKQLKINIVAEGVELEEQLNILKQLECDEFQGYLFGKPVPIREFERLLK